jgi:hypothetical protein
MHANTGIATDSARINRSVRWTRLLARPCRRLCAGRPMPELRSPAGGKELGRALLTVKRL